MYTRATVKTDTATDDKGCERVFIVQHPPRTHRVRILHQITCVGQGVKEFYTDSGIELQSLLNTVHASV